jgi:release factor glutamine methyltransferase
MSINCYNLPQHEILVKARATKLLQQHQQYHDAYTIQFFGTELTILPGVFCPLFGEGSHLLAECLNMQEGDTVLDLGTGSGALAILAADKSEKVVATDISPIAVKCAQINVKRLGLQNKVHVRQGDLFKPLKSSERFSLILFNPPFMEGKPTSLLESAIYDEEYRTLSQFFQNVESYLTEQGRILLAFSTVGNVRYLQYLIRQSAFHANLLKKEGVCIGFFAYELKK